MGANLRREQRRSAAEAARGSADHLGGPMSTGRVGDPPAPIDVEKKGDPRSTLSGKPPSAHWEIYPVAGGWRWRLRAPNGEPVATSGESFVDESGVRRAIATVISTVNAAALGYGEPVVEVVDS